LKGFRLTSFTVLEISEVLDRIATARIDFAEKQALDFGRVDCTEANCVKILLEKAVFRSEPANRFPWMSDSAPVGKRARVKIQTEKFVLLSTRWNEPPLVPNRDVMILSVLPRHCSNLSPTQCACTDNNAAATSVYRSLRAVKVLLAALRSTLTVLAPREGLFVIGSRWGQLLFH
jgi:hypothetical protein